MAATVTQTQYGDITPRQSGDSAKQFLSRGQYIMVLERFGQVDPLGKNKTKTRMYRRYEALPRVTSPLAEGITPSGHKLTKTDVTVNLEQYGDFVEITDVISDLHEDPVLREASGICGEQAAETIEVMRYNVLRAGTNVYYAGSATSRSQVSAVPTRGDFQRIIRQFNRDKAKAITSIIAASPKISTEPVAPSFFAIGHTDLESDIRNISGFVPFEQYSDSSKALPGEIGKVLNVRIILSALCEPWEAAGMAGTTYLSSGAVVTDATACDVYPLIFVARDAYAIVPLQGANAVAIKAMNPDSITKDDPLGQRGFVSWKTYQACVILQPAWLARLECAATANP